MNNNVPYKVGLDQCGKVQVLVPSKKKARAYILWGGGLDRDEEVSKTVPKRRPEKIEK